MSLDKHYSKGMVRSESGRVVVNVEANVKRKLYASLDLSGLTLKDWFTKAAIEYSREILEPSLFSRKQIDDASVSKRRKRGSKTYSVVSMFSGCGGMDLGFKGGFEIFGNKYPSLPFDIIWANDLNVAACKTYRQNLRHEITCGNVWDVMDTLPDSAEVVIGGFPCQDISVNGKGRGVDGPRSGLYRAMVKAIEKLKPRVFVAENVKGLLNKTQEDSLHRVISDFTALGYSVAYRLYNAADYGVPQTRQRVFIVGVLPGCFFFHPPMPERSMEEWMTAKEAISDLETLQESADFNHIWSKAKKSPEQGSRILKADRPGQTIRAECHGNIQFHYKLDRRISMREAARFQTFPDNFVFKSKLRETERQIGNAVPPVLAWHIATSVLGCLEGQA